MSLLAIIDGVAAGATLVLASATVHLGLQARRAAQEAAGGRLDQLGPAVLVREGSLERTAIAHNAVGADTHPLDSLLVWPEAQYGDVQLGVRCWCVIVNEGKRTALVRVTVPSGTVLEGFWPEPQEGDLPTLMNQLPQRDSSWVLAPGATAKLAVVTWKATAEWAAGARKEEDLPATEVRLECVAEPASVSDTCSVVYRKFPLWPGPAGGMVIAVSGTVGLFPSPPPEDVVKITQMVRRYPT